SLPEKLARLGQEDDEAEVFEHPQRGLVDCRHRIVRQDPLRREGVSEAAIVRDPRGRGVAARLAPLAAVFGHGGLPSPARLGRGRRGVLSTGDRAVTVPSERPFPLPPEWPRAVGCAAEPPSTARPPPTTARPCGAARERGGEPARR